MAFSESDYQISEFSQNMLIEITKDSRIASSITLSIIPRTIDEAVISGSSLPMNTPPDNPHSPNKASMLNLPYSQKFSPISPHAFIG